MRIAKITKTAKFTRIRTTFDKMNIIFFKGCREGPSKITKVAKITKFTKTVEFTIIHKTIENQLNLGKLRYLHEFATKNQMKVTYENNPNCDI